MDIGNRLKQLRKQKGYTTIELASKVNVTRIYITKLEHNENYPSFPLLEKICEVLGITLADFFNVNNQELSPELSNLLSNAKNLSPEQITKLNDFIGSINK